MLLIGDIMVSEALVEDEFVCHLEKCQGACCWKGDYGAPLEPAEMVLLEQLAPQLRSWLEPSSQQFLDSQGPFTYYAEQKKYGTTLRDDGACVFMRRNENGIAECAIERAHEAGEITFRKPISCHLYPVRVTRIEAVRFEALNYDQWSICAPACAHGEALQVPLYRFVREALIRRYGEAFYNELDAVARDLRSEAPAGTNPS
ncbi:MAG: DUF3109 family protein [Saprospiraceae bacterium]|nr:DUF3109 family protein [Saprospiraceae bacterium]